MDYIFIINIIFLVFITIVSTKENSQDEKTIDDNAIVSVKENINKTLTKEMKSKKFSRNSISLWPNLEKDQDLLLLEQVLEDIERGRGKSQRRKKLTKFLYPLFMGVLVAKIVLIPLILKMLTAIASSAMVMSKIAIITTGFIALKWIFSENTYDTKDRFEVIYLANGKPYRSASGGFSLYDDQSWSDSNNQYTAVVAPPATMGQQQKYIPVNLKHELPYKTYRFVNGGGSGGSSSGNSVGGAGSVGMIANKNGLGNSVKDLYYYAQHNYNNKNEGKPFL